MATKAELEAMLAEAEAALQQLQTGTQAVEVDYGDRKIVYNKTTSRDLEQRIQNLKIQLGLTSRSALGVYF